jgi:DNA-binding MarR family transcriptional regulator
MKMVFTEPEQNGTFPEIPASQPPSLDDVLMKLLNDSLVSLRRILRVADIQAKELAKKSGLTTSKLLVLQTIAEEGEVTIGAIATQVHLTQATITTIVDQLQEAGLVKRERATSDKRKVYVRLTEHGQEILDDAPTALHERFSEQFDELEEWEQMQIAATLKRLSHMLGAERIDAAPVLDTGMLDRKPES